MNAECLSDNDDQNAKSNDWHDMSTLYNNKHIFL